MIKKRLEWLKRGLCITLAGTMIICSDTMAFAAEAANGQVVEQTDATENETGGLTDAQSDQTGENGEQGGPAGGKGKNEEGGRIIKKKRKINSEKYTR